MRRCETLEALFDKVDLSFGEKVLDESYHAKDSVGRPPRSPLRVVKAHLLRRFDRSQQSTNSANPSLFSVPNKLHVFNFFSRVIGHAMLVL
jgi:hypothetical protein